MADNEGASYPALTEDARDAVIEAVWWWERYITAGDPVSRSAAMVELSNAMSDLESWVPRCCESGYFGQEHDCMKSDGALRGEGTE